MSSVKKNVVRVALIVLVPYVGVLLLLLWLENRIVFQPTRAEQNWAPAPTPDIQDVDLFTKDGTRIHAWWLPKESSDEAVLYFHGNAGNLSHRGASIVKLRQLLGMPVLIVDYPGYGKSDGEPGEQGCYAAADAAYAWLTDVKKIEPRKIVIYGASLGGGVAVELASRQPARALVLVKTFTSAPDVGQTIYPFLPVRWLMSNRFDSLARIGTVRCPIFIGHGDVDEMVPYRLGKRLFAAAPEPKEFFDMLGADHNSPLPAEFLEALKEFLRKHSNS